MQFINSYVQDFDLLVKVFCGDGGPHVRDDDNDARQSKWMQQQRRTKIKRMIT